MQSFVLYMFVCGFLANIFVLYKFFYTLYVSWKYK